MDNDEEETADDTVQGESVNIAQEVEKLRQENEKLRQENEDCKSRLQGLQTLGVLLDESRHEKENLRDQVTELSTKLSLQTTESSDPSEETTTAPSGSPPQEKTESVQNENVLVSLDEGINQTEGNGENDLSMSGMMSLEQSLRSSEEEQPLLTEWSDMPVSGEPLSDHAQRLEAALHDDGGPRKSTEMAAEMARFGSRVLQMEKKYNIQSVLVRDLTTENEDLKKKLADGLQEKNDIIRTLQNQVDDLQAELKAREDQGDEITQPVVKQNDDKQHSFDKEIDNLQTKVEELQRQKKEIIDVNKQWDVQYRSMKGSLEEKLEEAHRQIAEYRGQEDKRQRDIDKMLLSAKKRIDAEQEARERAVQDYQQEKQRGDTLSARVTLLENQITDMMRQRGNLEAEIRRLNGALGEAPSMAIRTPPYQAAERQQSAPRQSQPPSHNTQPSGSLDTRTEIEVLRAQVATYREDFETERGDRERIQGEKEALRDEMVALRLQVDYLSQQLRVYEEDFNRERRQKERLQRELRRRPMGAEDPAPYNAGPRQEEYIQPPPVQFYPPPPPYREQPPHYQQYYRPTAAEIQQRELSRYPQRGRLTPRGTGYQHGRFASQVIPRTLPTDVEHDCADGLGNQYVVGDCPRCQRLFDNPRDLQDHIQRCIT
ncbi:TNFAIP3-interacting protein 1-like isoform X1 [Branchiostoma floridae]|uniref:TNFAIP3-interacting protein 1-like isoform X1 n=1 Tax=Branchiostoma floridae TaxID=7739 RepID=A0A9J7KTM3_BRAFL|nr:TNFAIP3-interacting protein 1-like isoform X1 [Branchiostoma floridae]XP_035669763.1 TNFAIP3-interacting protein 1-like isoform X1 [Branchiostoma floridae]XP_035669764.1 TNFAIP3-interacting protein 1-like isoform X1 [Branchiostoma floridae]XP_035669765.1 TNFAIP3-interacting protein 1-like isoform X1 [Branchiostoma floridae]XP_035669766.1 TNFAIP3-interacting protein 1-like isoform X1 [Branchiostoma floridae]XP_035669767.1 TNFAIP3-interacting protein 1-like isoform X1 [Branchiostoma floridae]